jgi:hypothetical protein
MEGLSDTEHVDPNDQLCFVDSIQPCSVASICTSSLLELPSNSPARLFPRSSEVCAGHRRQSHDTRPAAHLTQSHTAELIHP